MTTNAEYPTTSDEEDSLEEEKTVSGSTRRGEFQGRVFKWTNYLHGWQERYLILRQGFLNYYKNEYDSTLGCRGALAVRQVIIQPHEFDDCRFDIRVGDSVWYLRAHSTEDRERWMQVLEEHKQLCKSDPDYGGETNLRRHPSIGSLASTASASVASTGSFRRDRNLKEKLYELETFRELLGQQVQTLQTYFDACANSVTKGFEPYQKEYENAHDLDFEDSVDKSHATPTLSNESGKIAIPKSKIEGFALDDHGAMSVDFKGEALTFKATTDGVIHNLTICIELMQKREDIWRKKYEKELERRKKFQDLYGKIIKQNIPALGSPDAEEGPHSTLKEDEFYDAIDQSLDRIDRETDDLYRSKAKHFTMKSFKKTFHIPPSYAFTAGCSNPTTVVSLAPFVSSCASPLNYVGGLRPYYQQRKFLITPNLPSRSSSPSPSTVGIHSTDDDQYETPPSSVDSGDEASETNPFEVLAKKENINQTKSSSKPSSDRSRTTTIKSKSSTNATAVSATGNHNALVGEKHRLSAEIERIVQGHLKYKYEDVSDGWDLIHQEGEMKVYRREVEENGLVLDPMKIFHTIKGVTGHEICHYFWEFQYRMEWETTLDSTKIIEVLDPQTVVFYQVHKRVWPAAQRDSCFWSHIRSFTSSDEDQPTWLVVNYTTSHLLAPIKSPQVRIVANVALICETVINEPPLNPKDIKRENIECKLTYVAFVNPGGWVPSAALRSVAKREYPRFLKRFSSYVLEQTRDKPILF
ncbi:unnamed protein product [Adineta ricciae]|uniref:Ceramide transfer protein n=1 Tax=Adineta ricciae TaxID=249248 RepID=A0A815J2R1_ADIRI|nr:unnamed protein product [Adineta ricciae]